MQTKPLRMNYEFSRVYKKGRFVSGRYLVVHYLRRRGRFKRLGVTASRQVKNSVGRNRVKRLLRESYRAIEDQVCDGYDLILVGRNNKKDPGCQQMQTEMLKLLNKAGLLERKREDAHDPPLHDLAD